MNRHPVVLKVIGIIAVASLGGFVAVGAAEDPRLLAQTTDTRTIQTTRSPVGTDPEKLQVETSTSKRQQREIPDTTRKPFSPSDTPRTAATLRETLLDMRALRNLVDRSQFDLQALIDRLDYDPELVIRFVRDEIAYEHYEGVLRGAIGTLQARAGNSLDQALLVANLLKEAGVDARIVEGRVESSLLLDAMQPDAKSIGSPRALYTDPGAADQILTRLRSGGAPVLLSQPAVVPEPMRELQSRSREISDGLLDALVNHEVRLADMPVSLLEPGSLSRYFWVQYREGAAADWIDSHPALHSGLTLPDPEPERYFSDSIPPELHQTLTLQAFMETRTGNRIETVAVMAPWSRPVANLRDKTLSYVNMPDRLLLDRSLTLSELPDEISEAELFVPLLNGHSIEEDHAFTLAGDLIPASAALSSMAGLFKTLSGRLDRASSALSGLSGQPGAPVALRGINRFWLELTLDGPDMAAVRISRDLANGAQTDQDFVAGLSRNVDIRVETGTPSMAQLAYKSLETQELLLRAELAKLEGESFDELPTSIDDLASPPWVQASDWFFAITDTIGSHADDARIYRARPTIVAFYTQLRQIGNTSSGFDILHNPRTVVDLRSGHVQRTRTLELGVLDTVVEGFLFGDQDHLRSAAINRLEPIDPSGWRLLQASGSSSSLGQNGVEHDLIERDLKEIGLVLAVPPTPPTAVPEAWWSIDPVSGATIGKLDNGWGGKIFTEYMTMLTKAASIHGAVKIFGAASVCAGVAVTIKIALGLEMADKAGLDAKYICRGLQPPYDVACEATVTIVAGLGSLAHQRAEGKAFEICMAAVISAPFPP